MQYKARKVSKFGVFSVSYFPVFEVNTGKYGPEKTPYLDTFLAVVNKVASTKATGVNNNRNEWFDGEITVKIVARDKLFREF